MGLKPLGINVKVNLEQQNIWFTSDNHYGHGNVIKYSNRPFLTYEDKAERSNIFLVDGMDKRFKPSSASVYKMDEEMIALHNSVVQQKDIVRFNGDFAFYDVPEIERILKRLNGQKHLVLGNHDKNIRKNIRALTGPALFQSIKDYEEVTVIEPQPDVTQPTHRKKIILLHYGMRVWNHSHHGSWHLYGHSHGSLESHGKSTDCGVDATWITGKAEYRPFSYDEVKYFMSKQKIVVLDHHDGDDHS